MTKKLLINKICKQPPHAHLLVSVSVAEWWPLPLLPIPVGRWGTALIPSCHWPARKTYPPSRNESSPSVTPEYCLHSRTSPPLAPWRSDSDLSAAGKMCLLWALVGYVMTRRCRHLEWKNKKYCCSIMMTLHERHCVWNQHKFNYLFKSWWTQQQIPYSLSFGLLFHRQVHPCHDVIMTRL